MERFYSLLLTFCLVLIKVAGTENNYCSRDLCPAGKPHIACKNNGRFSTHCPKTVKMVSLDRYQKMILNMHNSKRNLIASGRLKGYNSAKRMATMQWDPELAKLAALNVKQCQMQHDKCRNTQTFSKAGQNLAMITYDGPVKSKSDSELIRNRINAWWNEYKKCNSGYIQKYPSNYSGPDIGHFTVFVAEKNVRVGCAAIRFTNGKKHNFLIGCNYATTNIVGEPIYRAGASGEACTTGRNLQYTSLCSEKEKYAEL